MEELEKKFEEKFGEEVYDSHEHKRIMFVKTEVKTSDILQWIKANQPESQVIWRYELNQKVKRDKREGKIIDRYTYTSEILKIFYDELYAVEWDDGQIERGFLSHGLIAI